MRLIARLKNLVMSLSPSISLSELPSAIRTVLDEFEKDAPLIVEKYKDFVDELREKPYILEEYIEKKWKEKPYGYRKNIVICKRDPANPSTAFCIKINTMKKKKQLYVTRLAVDEYINPTVVERNVVFVSSLEDLLS